LPAQNIGYSSCTGVIRAGVNMATDTYFLNTLRAGVIRGSTQPYDRSKTIKSTNLAVLSLEWLCFCGD